MEIKPFIPYNTSLKDYGRTNRNQKNLTKPEGIFRNSVLKGDKTGYRFLRQKLIGSFRFLLFQAETLYRNRWLIS